MHSQCHSSFLAIQKLVLFALAVLHRANAAAFTLLVTGIHQAYEYKQVARL